MSALSQRLQAPARERVVKNPQPWYTPRFWHGMRASTWVKQLAANRFAVSPSRWGLALTVSGVSAVNSALAAIDDAMNGRRVAKVELAEPPLFILGHWRAGTTLLHELLIRDPRHTYPSTYQCFVPHHFLVSQSLLAPLTSVLLPKRRPMDNMVAGWERPQEDEFALENMGVPTPYLSMMFPNRGPVHDDYLTLHDLPPAARQRWCDELVRFFRRVALHDNRRIVVKSPGHTARVAVLAELFPGARFVHIAREPCALYASSVALWRSLNALQSMQAIGDETWIEAHVRASLKRMYEAYFADRNALAPNQLVELRYEDLVAHPKAGIKTVYEQLELGDFDAAEPNIDAHLAEVKNYRPNLRATDEALAADLREEWGDYFREFGYDR
ncbi:MAG: sulfotransferase [Planctomycetales bacterium]|nr:sulfotransferase [Planctomycetales bacterium]